MVGPLVFAVAVFLLVWAMYEELRRQLRWHKQQLTTLELELQVLHSRLDKIELARAVAKQKTAAWAVGSVMHNGAKS